MALGGLEVDIGAGCDANLVADDFEESGRVVCQRVGERIACVRIDGGEHRGDRTLGRVLVHIAATKSDVGRPFVEQVIDRDRHDFRVGVATGVRYLDRDVMALCGLEINIGSGRDPHFVANDLEESGRIVGQRIGESVACVLIDRGEHSGNRTLGRVLVDVAAGERDVGRSFVGEIVDRNRDHFRIGVAAGIGHFDRKVVAIGGLKVDVGAGRHANLVADDFEEPGRVVGDGVGVAVARVRIDRGEHRRHRALRCAFVDIPRLRG